MSSGNHYIEEPVSWKVDGIEVQASLTHPAGVGPFPAVIFVAGSGPTDRNWNSPMLPGANGSGALLARELTEHGFITLRYDKRASGPRAAENVKNMAGKISMQGHLAELAGGIQLLANNSDANPARIFALTNSEGCVHALNYQNQRVSAPLAGLVLTSAFARPTGAVARSQIAAQFGVGRGGEAVLATYDFAIEEFIAGRPVPANDKLLEGLQQLIKGITHPINLPFSRELWLFNPITTLANVRVPVLIVLGKKDIQIDWQIDGPIFEALVKEHANISISYFENTNHVMKFEPKPRAQLTAAEVAAGYSAENAILDAEPVAAIISWLRAQL